MTKTLCEASGEYLLAALEEAVTESTGRHVAAWAGAGLADAVARAVDEMRLRECESSIALVASIERIWDRQNIRQTTLNRAPTHSWHSSSNLHWKSESGLSVWRQCYRKEAPLAHEACPCPLYSMRAADMQSRARQQWLNMMTKPAQKQRAIPELEQAHEMRRFQRNVLMRRRECEMIRLLMHGRLH